ncbi:hypothetical protein AB0M46_08280, partial [Dactylosporangium sp. NPDC051485]|uniref:hypothetical protein n=1 Tax=Dactylosporangium sp. NPDC051485 TaxID=3154846 RepID=UPI00341D2609
PGNAERPTYGPRPTYQDSQHTHGRKDEHIGRPWANGREYLNFAETKVDTSRAFDPATWRRLQDVRRAADPDGLFVANHVI